MDPRTVLIVTELEGDAARHAAVLGDRVGLTVHTHVGADDVLAAYLDTRPDVVVLDGLTDPEEPAAIIRQLSAIGFAATAVPFLVVVDDDSAAVRCLEAGAWDIVRRSEVASTVLTNRVLRALETRAAQLRVRAQREELLQAAMAGRLD